MVTSNIAVRTGIALNNPNLESGIRNLGIESQDMEDGESNLESGIRNLRIEEAVSGELRKKRFEQLSMSLKVVKLKRFFIEGPVRIKNYELRIKNQGRIIFYIGTHRVFVSLVDGLDSIIPRIHGILNSHVTIG